MSGKSALVEGALIGSLMAGVLLLPGCSMVSGGVKRKEQRFNAKSAGTCLMIRNKLGLTFRITYRGDFNNAYYGYHWSFSTNSLLSNVWLGNVSITSILCFTSWTNLLFMSITV